jgi:Asp-tRNA(Asn)/Glu-tRNA(Gln) amidotransferase A subunit family amidase
MNLNELDATTASVAIRGGEISSEQLVKACLDRISAIEGRVQAWSFLDPEHALRQARDCDKRQSNGGTIGPLHGIPVGIKDVYDTADLPTQYGSVIFAGRRPVEDATVVSLLRKAGAVIMGKTVTAELAVYAPGKTTNPHDERRTPGGSSSGSAAAVAARMIPLAVGTQTNGSLIRPASYCGVYGFKPSHGLISRHGILAQSRCLDQPGVFARSVDDVALITKQLVGHDDKDADIPENACLDLGEDWREPHKAKPRIAFVKSPVWNDMTEAAVHAFKQLNEKWSDLVCEVELPPMFDTALQAHRIIMESDMAKSYGDIYERGKDRLSANLREMIERGRQYKAIDYSGAMNEVVELKRELDRLLAGFDAILTPATASEAPIGLASTGSPMFCTIWTLCGVPAISLPILEGQNRMPLGAQLVGRKGGDVALLRLARWLADRERIAAGR